VANINQQHLGPDKGEDHCQGWLKIDKLVNDTGEQEIQRAQTKDSADVGSVDDERIVGNAKDRRDRVDSKENVGRLDQISTIASASAAAGRRAEW